MKTQKLSWVLLSICIASAICAPAAVDLEIPSEAQEEPNRGTPAPKPEVAKIPQPSNSEIPVNAVEVPVVVGPGPPFHPFAPPPPPLYSHGRFPPINIVLSPLAPAYPQTVIAYPQTVVAQPPIYPQQQGIYPQQVVYPPQQVSYPQQVVYPQQQVSYPQQQVAYPQQQVAYPQQQVAYPQQQVAYPQQQVSYPQQQVVSPQRPNAVISGSYPAYPPNKKTTEKED